MKMQNDSSFQGAFHPGAKAMYFGLHHCPVLQLCTGGEHNTQATLALFCSNRPVVLNLFFTPISRRLWFAQKLQKRSATSMLCHKMSRLSTQHADPSLWYHQQSPHVNIQKYRTISSRRTQWAPQPPLLPQNELLFRNAQQSFLTNICHPTRVPYALRLNRPTLDSSRFPQLEHSSPLSKSWISKGSQRMSHTHIWDIYEH